MICNRTLSIISTNEDSGSSCLFGVGKNYFFKLLSTPQGEAMLHQSIRKEIDKFIDPNLEVICSHPNSFLEKVLFNDILGRCLITMIQSRSTHRGECIHYLKIMNNLLEILKEPTKHFTHVDLLKGLLQLKSSTMDALRFENQSMRAQLLRYEQTLREICNISRTTDSSHMAESLDNIYQTCKKVLQ
ncbi:predicted protein [Naegleria gruberi]|uniref:Predicted protein n=1 Tax=Naegleria gruberi TaxID=5762 RepID=D2VZ77_NAEGR|nr:uncharacterized protein NAEGRDRAFT_74391 [Naegleria gruberi]EFC37945.1 predicted protein [Naegleria gruberi]|eukprot:XP_002670689.1 predicted protein [Naegleria gruberi strain NEG-M]